MGWVPFGMEEGMSSALVGGVPDYMKNSLIDWMTQAELLLCNDAFSEYDAMYIDLDERHNLINEFDRRTKQESCLYDADTARYFRISQHSDSIGLQYVDFLLMKLDEAIKDEQYVFPPSEEFHSHIQNLDIILEESGSKWKVGSGIRFAGWKSAWIQPCSRWRMMSWIHRADMGNCFLKHGIILSGVSRTILPRIRPPSKPSNQ